jgi:hypothetical protein
MKIRIKSSKMVSYETKQVLEYIDIVKKDLVRTLG